MAPGVAAGAAPRAVTRRRAAGVGDPGIGLTDLGHVDPLAVGDLGGEVQPVEIAVGQRPADRLDGVDHPRAGAQLDHPRVGHRARDVHRDRRRSTLGPTRRGRGGALDRRGDRRGARAVLPVLAPPMPMRYHADAGDERDDTNTTTPKRASACQSWQAVGEADQRTVGHAGEPLLATRELAATPSDAIGDVGSSWNWASQNSRSSRDG